MSIINNAINAYANAGNIASAKGKEDTDKSGEGGGLGGFNFGSMLKDSLQDAIGTQKQAETISMASTRGEAQLTDVVTAVTNAEVTLQTVVGVRDRIINAYQEIMRMPI